MPENLVEDLVGNEPLILSEEKVGSVPLSQYLDLEQNYLQQQNMFGIFEEKIYDLEIALEDSGWAKENQGAEGEFSREGINRIIALSRMVSLKNPLVLRALEVKANYIWGQGMNWKARHPKVQKVLESFVDDSKNKIELTSHQARLAKQWELETDGNIFFVFFTSEDGVVRLRTIPAVEVKDILTNPEDTKEPWYYKREYLRQETNFETGKVSNKTITSYYPHYKYNPEDKKDFIGKTGRGRNVVNSEVIWNSPVYHVKIGGFSDWKFGVPGVYAAIDWARVYKQFLEDWATVTRAYATFAFQLLHETGGSAQVKANAAKLQNAIGSGQPSEERRPISVNGGVNRGSDVGKSLAAPPGTRLEPIRTSGATTSASDGRWIKLMVAAALGLPESFFGDASNSNYATAKTLDRPTELMMKNRQTLWADIHMEIFGYVILQAVKSGELQALGEIETDEDGTETIKWNDVIPQAEDGEDEKQEEFDPHIDIDFPPVLSIDVLERMQAIVAAAPFVTDAKLVAKWVLLALGEDDIDEIIKSMFPNDQNAPKVAAANVEDGDGSGVSASEDPVEEAQRINYISQKIVTALRESRSNQEIAAMLEHFPVGSAVRRSPRLLEEMANGEKTVSKKPATAANYGRLGGRGNPNHDEKGHFAKANVIGSGVSTIGSFNAEIGANRGHRQKKGETDLANKEIGVPRSRQREKTVAENFRAATDEDRKQYGIPPKYTDAYIINDGVDSNVVAMATPPGKSKWGWKKYTVEFTEQQAADKHARIKVLAAKMPDVQKAMDTDAQDGNNAAMAARLIRRTGMRPGGEGQTGRVKVYGATTLELRHVRTSGDWVHFNFIGKENIRQQHRIEDPLLARYVEGRKAKSGAKTTSKLFDVDADDVNAYIDRKAKNFTSKDFRTHRATEIAIAQIQTKSAPKDFKEFKNLQGEVADVVASKLGNKTAQSLETYIDPTVWLDLVDGLPEGERKKWRQK